MQDGKEVKEEEKEAFNPEERFTSGCTLPPMPVVRSQKPKGAAPASASTLPAASVTAVPVVVPTGAIFNSPVAQQHRHCAPPPSFLQYQ
jgi:hypothetical protein